MFRQRKEWQPTVDPRSKAPDRNPPARFKAGGSAVAASLGHRLKTHNMHASALLFKNALTPDGLLGQ